MFQSYLFFKYSTFASLIQQTLLICHSKRSQNPRGLLILTKVGHVQLIDMLFHFLWLITSFSAFKLDLVMDILIHKDILMELKDSSK
jgi:hypothetical protein